MAEFLTLFQFSRKNVFTMSFNRSHILHFAGRSRNAILADTIYVQCNLSKDHTMQTESELTSKQ